MHAARVTGATNKRSDHNKHACSKLGFSKNRQIKEKNKQANKQTREAYTYTHTHTHPHANTQASALPSEMLETGYRQQSEHAAVKKQEDNSRDRTAAQVLADQKATATDNQDLT